MYSVLECLWSHGDDFDFLVSYIKPDYKILKRNLISLNDNTLLGDVICCYFSRVSSQSKKGEYFKLQIKYLRNDTSMLSFLFSTIKTPSLAALNQRFHNKHLL